MVFEPLALNTIKSKKLLRNGALSKTWNEVHGLSQYIYQGIEDDILFLLTCRLKDCLHCSSAVDFLKYLKGGVIL